MAKLVQKSCYLGNLAQLVTSPTRIQHNSVANTTAVSCIDHVYTNARFRCSSVNITSFGASDHSIIEYIRYLKIPPTPARTIVKRSYKYFDCEAFLQDLRKINWSDVYRCTEVDAAVDIFTHHFTAVLNNHAPWIRYQQRRHYSHWITEDTKSLIKQRDNQKKKYEDLALKGDTAAAEEAWKAYKQVRNKVNNKKKYEEKSFKSHLIASSLGCPSKLWSSAKNLMDWKQVGGPPTQLSIDGVMVTSPSKIAKEMNEFFLNKVEKIRQGIRNIPNLLTGPKKVMQNKNCQLDFKAVSVKKINQLIKLMKISRSTSIDELDNFCLKISADIIDIPIHHIITLSISQKKFPESWKLSKVIPLHKKDCRLNRKKL